MNETDARNAVVAAGKRLVESGLIARTWGNVSARISDTHFVITPSGRDYLSLTAEDIVPVAIADRSYTGSIKPSGERGVHAEIYRAHPHVNFVIHTHQEMASIVASTSVHSIPAGAQYPELGERVLCSDYALPSTKAIRENVDLTPRGIIDRLELARPIYQPTATYGHFGRAGDEDGSFTWERLDLVDLLRRAV